MWTVNRDQDTVSALDPDMWRCALGDDGQGDSSSEAVPAEAMYVGAVADWAEQIEIEKLAEHYEERLEEAGFFFPDHKAANMKQNLRNLWSRMPLTRADVQMLHGIMRQMVRWKDR